MIKWRDLKLTYYQALHGMQSAIKFKMERGDSLADPKHLRVGLDARACDQAALVSLLIEKGLITEEEYLERIRLSLNEELAELENGLGHSFR